jgi:iron-sulfur cluster assembly accessory protein
MITVTETAAQEVKRLQSSRQKPDSYLRVKINHGGCCGLYYQLELNETSAEGGEISASGGQGSCASGGQQSCASGARQYESRGIVITVDADSSAYLEDLEIDYSEDLMGGGFRFDNFKAMEHCNCGQSFSLKHT